MSKIKKTQLLLIIGAVVLFVLLFFANKKPSAKPIDNGQQAEVTGPTTIESFVKTAESVLAPELKQKTDSYFTKANGAAKKQWLDSIIAFWDKQKRPDIASFYFEEKAKESKDAVTWFKAGDRYY